MILPQNKPLQRGPLPEIAQRSLDHLALLGRQRRLRRPGPEGRSLVREFSSA